MRQKLITLCPTSFELALKKDNFSAWVRDRLLGEARSNEKPWKYCKSCDTSMKTNESLCVNPNCIRYMRETLEELE